jgi:hypothetical protein
LKWGSIVPAVLWIAHNYLGLKAANSPKTSSNNEKVKPANGADVSWIARLLKNPQLLDRLARLAPYVFGIGMVLLLATAVHIVAGLLFDPVRTSTLWHPMPGVTRGNEWPVLCDLYWRIQWAGSPLQLLAAGGILAFASLLLSRRVDVNDFSLHHF